MTTVQGDAASGVDDDYADVAALFAQIQHLPTESAQVARLRDLIVTRCLGLADGVARHYAGRGQDLEDLTQVARVGLVKAVRRFDPVKCSNFVVFAIPTMAGEVRRHFRDHGWATHVPRRIKDRNATLIRATAALMQSRGRAPTAGELAEYLQLSRDDVLDSLLAAQAYQLHSLDAPLCPGDAAPRMIAETIGEVDAAFDRITDQQTVRPLLAALPPREQTVLYLRFFESKSQSQIAAHLGISQMHVSRILDKTLRTLRDQL